MSGPPQLIRVKRKATEEAPISFLRVQETKRHRSGDYVYQRQRQAAASADAEPSIQRPAIQSSRPKQKDHGAPALQGDEKPRQHQNRPDDAAKKAADSRGGSPLPELRRFHMSRSDTMSATSPCPSSRSLSGVSKKRPGTALFIERKIKKLPSRKLEAINHGLATHGPIPVRSASRTPPVSESPQTEEMEVGATAPKKYKKPGLNKVAAQAGATTAKSELPPAMLDRWNVNLDKLTADMNAFALEQIGLNIQQAEKTKPAARKPASVMAPPRFKPKAPAQRYAERHPEETREHADQKMSDADVVHSDSDDDDYVIETYIRVPLKVMKKQKVPPGSVGLLVFDCEPDRDFFCGESSDSEDGWPEDDEDENAENYYTADYPDDEVATDDEYGRNAYSFRNGNASDLEEYDIDEDSDSADDGLGGKEFKAFRGRDGLVTKHL